jgi:aldehyde:ferredoxin oxidoreductase
MAHMLELVTGWNTTGEELLTAAGRIITAKKLFNVRVGWTPEEDRLPRRFLTQALAGGASAGALLTEDRLAELILHYNRGRGWRDDGTPAPDQAAEIDALVVPYAARPSLL